MELSKDQTQAFEFYKTGRNVFISGPGGAGKTELITNDNCGVRFLIPATSWLAINHIRKINMDRIYGIKIKNILASGGVIFLGYSFIHHYFKK